MRIKVTGYLETDDLPFNLVDLDHKTGLSEQGFEHFMSGDFTGPTALDGVETERVAD